MSIVYIPHDYHDYINIIMIVIVILIILFIIFIFVICGIYLLPRSSLNSVDSSNSLLSVYDKEFLLDGTINLDLSLNSNKTSESVDELINESEINNSNYVDQRYTLNDSNKVSSNDFYKISYSDNHNICINNGESRTYLGELYYDVKSSCVVCTNSSKSIRDSETEKKQKKKRRRRKYKYKKPKNPFK
jgi:hypothetical protein